MVIEDTGEEVNVEKVLPVVILHCFMYNDMAAYIHVMKWGGGCQTEFSCCCFLIYKYAHNKLIP